MLLPGVPSRAVGSRRTPSAAQPLQRPQCRPRQRAVRCTAKAEPAKHADTVRKSRSTQIQATELMVKLLKAPNPQATVEEHQASLSEEFFAVGNAYLGMAQKEGNQEVLRKLETVLKLAMAEKQKTLRPEIQLLNRLLQAGERLERQRHQFKGCKAGPDKTDKSDLRHREPAETGQAPEEILNTKAAGETLTMNDRYFFGLVQRMQKDVARQRDNPSKSEIAQKLQEIQEDADARLPPGIKG